MHVFKIESSAGFSCGCELSMLPRRANKVRKPDVSLIRSGRLVDDKTPQGHCPIPPDLAVEVVSPGDLVYELEEKVAEYQKVGVPLIWVVQPLRRFAFIDQDRRRREVFLN